MFLILALVLVFVLPSPWSLVGFAICLALFLGELALWHRKVRGLPRMVGSGKLIGAEGVAVSACRPVGQVRVGGEIWSARCSEGAEVGDRVSVTRVDGLVLVVRKTDQDGAVAAG